jgi:hypothetical protein
MLDPSYENWPNSTAHTLVEQAVVLEKNYKEMLVQGDEVELRVSLWRDALEVCKINSKSMSCPRI